MGQTVPQGQTGRQKVIIEPRLRHSFAERTRYFDFPEQQYREFLDTESHGRYFLSRVRNHFRYERLAKLQTA